MAAAVAGEVLGPRPGKAICSFWQGNVEILLRGISAVIGSLPALVAASVAVGVTNARDFVNGPAVGNSSYGTLERNTYGSAGWVIGIAGLAIIFEILLVILRFCNIGLVNLKIKIFLMIDIILSIIFALGHLAGGIAMAIYAADWTDLISPSSDDPETIRNSLAASAAFCFLAIFLYGFLAVWSIFFLAKEWNDKVVKYTLKEAITG